MTSVRVAAAVAVSVALALALAGCEMGSAPVRQPDRDPPTKGFPTTPEVLDSVYLPVDRNALPPPGYGLYSVLLTRAANVNTLRTLSELFKVTVSAGDAAIPIGNLNLITLPVKSATEARLALASARNQPGASAANVMQNFYDFGQAARLMAQVCRPDRGAAVMKACGSAASEGPLLVTTLQPLDAAVSPDQRILIVNLSTTSPEAVGEVLASYRRQILRKDFAKLSKFDEWRLLALDQVLTAARLLPEISKAQAGTIK